MRQTRREPFRYGWIWLVYVLLYAASVPWYLSADTRPAIWLGLPYWALLSLLATAGIALFTVLVVRSFWDDTDPM